MEAVSICKGNGVRQIVSLRKSETCGTERSHCCASHFLRAEPTRVPREQKTAKARPRPSQKLSAANYFRSRWSSMYKRDSVVTQRCALTSVVAIKKYPGHCTPLATKPSCPVCASAPLAVSSNYLLVLERLHDYILLPSMCRSAENQPSNTSMAARVTTAHTRSASLSNHLMSSLRLDVSRALPAFCFFLYRLSSPALTMFFHTLRLALIFNAPTISSLERVNRKKSRKKLCKSVSE